MKRLLYLVTLSLVATMLFAPAALARSGGPGGEGPCTEPFEGVIPLVNGCVTTEGQPDPGSAIVYDADTREPIGTLDEVTSNIEAQQYVPTVTTTTMNLPDTGGISLLIPASLLLASGLIGLGVMRRK